MQVRICGGPGWVTTQVYPACGAGPRGAEHLFTPVTFSHLEGDVGPVGLSGNYVLGLTCSDCEISDHRSEWNRHQQLLLWDFGNWRYVIDSGILGERVAAY